MGILSDILSGNMAHPSAVNYNAVERESPEERRQQIQFDRAETQKTNLLGNDNQLDSRVAGAVEAISPSTARPKYNKFGTKTEAVDASIPQDHPLYGVADKLKQTYTSMLQDPQYAGVDPGTLMQAAKQSVYTPELKQATMAYKAKADSSIGNFFGLFGENKSIAKPAGFDQWKQNVENKKAAQVDAEGGTNPLESFATGAAFSAAGTALGATAAALGIAATAPVSVPVALTSALVAGAVAIPTFALGDMAKKLVEKSDYNIFHGEDTSARVLGALGGAALGAVAGKGAAVKAVMGTAGAALGAADPTSVPDFAAFIGGEKLLSYGGEKLLGQALKRGMLNEQAQQAFSMHPDAKNIIDTYKTGIASAAEKEAAATVGNQAMQLQALKQAQLEKGLQDIEEASGGKYKVADLKQLAGGDSANMSPEGRDKLGNLLKLVMPEDEVNALMAKPRSTFEGPSSAFPRASTDVSKNPSKKDIKSVTDELATEQNKQASGAFWDAHVSEVSKSLNLSPEQMQYLSKDKNLRAIADAVRLPSMEEQYSGLDPLSIEHVLTPSEEGIASRLNTASQMTAIRERLSASELHAAINDGMQDVGAVNRDTMGVSNTPEKIAKAEKEKADFRKNANYDEWLSGNTARALIGGSVLGAGLLGTSQDSQASMGSDLAKVATEQAAPFFSKVAQFIGDKLTGGTTKDGLVKMLNGKASADEIKLVTEGLPEGKLSKQDVLDHVKSNDTQFVDHVFGGGTPNPLNQLQQTIKEKYPNLVVNGSMDFNSQRNQYKVFLTDIGDKNTERFYTNPSQIEDKEMSDFVRNAIEQHGFATNNYGNTSLILDKSAEARYADHESLNTPGAVPGSHRELFVTAPGDYATEHSSEEQLLGMGKKYGNDVTKWPDVVPNWKDGHEDYSSVENPIVRLRMHDRELEGKKILHIDEMQGPQDAEQANMPKYLRSRIYDIGTKRALAYAKEGGYDGVSWTTGAQQAERYSLEKDVHDIVWRNGGDDGLKDLYVKFKGGDTANINIDGTGKVIGGKRQLVGQPLSKVLGDEAAAQILSKQDGILKGDGLKIGGQGLKNLYDTQLPSKFGEYGKEGVSSIDLIPPKVDGSGRWVEPPLIGNFIPITQNTPSSFGKFAVAGATGLGALTYQQQQSQQADQAVQATNTFAQQKSVAENLGDIIKNISFGATDANASMLSNVLKNKAISGAVADLAKSMTGSSTDIAKEILPYVGSYAKDSDVSARGILKERILNTAPQSHEDLLKTIQADGKAPIPGMGATSPQFGARTLFSSVKDAEGKLFGSPAVQLADAQMAITHNSNEATKVTDNIIKKFAPDILNEKTTDIIEHMKPAQEAFDAVGTKYQMLTNAGKQVRGEIDELTKQLKGASLEDRAGINAAIQQKEGMIKQMADERQNYQKDYDLQSANVEAYQRTAAEKWGRSRISLYAEDPTFTKYSWLQPLMKDGEIQAGDAFRDMMDHYKERAQRQGMDVIAENYITHSRQKLPEMDAAKSEMNKYFENIGMDATTKMPLTQFFERTEMSRQFIPDIEYNVKTYIPDAERRLAANDFYKQGNMGDYGFSFKNGRTQVGEAGWDAVQKSIIVQGTPSLKEYFQRIEDAFRPPEQTTFNKLADQYTALESTRLLLGLPSAPFKHLFKLVPEMGRLGVSNVLPVYPAAMATTLRNFARDGVSSMVERGFVTPEFAENFLSSSKQHDQLISAIIGQHNMTNYLTDLNRSLYNPLQGAASNFVDKLATASGIGIKAVESFDRTVTVLATMRMAEKQGMTGQQAMYGIYDTILQNNFLSGMLNPSWGKDPKVRAAFMFQQTPFKILESRMSDAITTGRDLKTAWGMIKNGDLQKEFEKMQQLKGDMAEGELKFKAGLLFDAVTSSKDVWGNPISGQFVKQALGVGALMAGGSAMGVNLTPQLLHLPFVTTEGEENKLSLSPAIKAATGTLTGSKPQGKYGEDWEPEEHNSVMSRLSPETFYKHWYGTTGYSLFASKVGKITENDIPEMYKGSVFKYMFSLKGTD